MYNNSKSNTGGYNKSTNNGYNRFNKQEETKIEFEFSTKGFYDSKGYIREELLTTEAEKIAKLFADVENNGRNKLSNSQLRAFFNEVKGLNNRISRTKDNWQEVYPMVLMIKSKIEYRASKDTKMNVLKMFLLKGIAYIQKSNRENKGCETFKTFVTFFEAIVGYSYGQGIK